MKQSGRMTVLYRPGIIPDSLLEETFTGQDFCTEIAIFDRQIMCLTINCIYNGAKIRFCNL